MNLENIFSEIEKKDPDFYDRMDTRRDSMRRFVNFGSKVALTALPFALGSMFKKAYGGTTPSSIVDILNFALTLEYLESTFYTTGFNKNTITQNNSYYDGFKAIKRHEVEHVNFLTATITALGGTPAAKPKFDFTAGGLFPHPFTDYATFLALAQTFEDTGVRAYKGQVTGLMSNDTVLSAAVRIHSVEARHASFLRSVRAEFTQNWGVRPWISQEKSGGIGDAVAANYAGEGNTEQLGIQIRNINNYDVSDDAATESFDEPLTMNQVLALVDPFIVD